MWRPQKGPRFGQTGKGLRINMAVLSCSSSLWIKRVVSVWMCFSALLCLPQTSGCYTSLCARWSFLLFSPFSSQSLNYSVYIYLTFFSFVPHGPSFLIKTLLLCMCRSEKPPSHIPCKWYRSWLVNLIVIQILLLICRRVVCLCRVQQEQTLQEQLIRVTPTPFHFIFSSFRLVTL